jgi:regulator of protease activity HflC (stomatin/prohibitin superfamily)
MSEGNGSVARSTRSYNKAISLIFMLILLLGYWLYVWQFERINLTQTPPIWWSTIVERFPLFQIFSRFFLSLLELLSPSVLRHFIPIILGGWLARISISRFLESFYDLPDHAAANSLLSRLLAWGVPNRPVGSVSHREFKVQKETNPQLHVGGPGLLFVSQGTVALTEKNGRFIRSLGPGSHVLDRFEYPAAVLDVRPQEREATNVKMITSDGIDLTADVSVTFQIGRGGQEPSREQTFPYDPDAARKAAYSMINFSDEQDLSWDTITLFITTSELRNLVAESRLDELIRARPSGIHPHPRLKRAMEHRARLIMRNEGVEISDSHLGRFDLPEIVVQQNINFWRSQWEKKPKLPQLETEATTLEEADRDKVLATANFVQELMARLSPTRSPYDQSETKSYRALEAVEGMEAHLRRAQDSSPIIERQLAALGNLKQQLLNE